MVFGLTEMSAVLPISGNCIGCMEPHGSSHLCVDLCLDWTAFMRWPKVIVSCLLILRCCAYLAHALRVSAKGLSRYLVDLVFGVNVGVCQMYALLS